MELWFAEMVSMSQSCIKQHTQTRPFKPTAISKDNFLPNSSSTGQVGELSSLEKENRSGGKWSLE